MAEVAETRAKAAGLLAAFGTRRVATPARPPALGNHPEVRRALAGRNAGLAKFWLDRPRATGAGPLTGARILVIDAEDTFTAMLGHQVRALGAEVTIRRYDLPWDATGQDIVVLGPGPGDPRDTGDPKIATLRAAAGRLLAARVPLLGVCLGHQVLGSVLGLGLVRRERPNQGVRREIDFFGRTRRVGFYNSFAVVCAAAEITVPAVAGPLAVSRDPATGEVHGLRGAGLCSMQFHPESLLTEDGPDILAEALTALPAARPVAI
jgi:phenazine biosynthesis protein phzE